MPAIVCQGPAVLVLDGENIYCDKDIIAEPNYETFEPGSQLGSLGERHKSIKWKISATPIGMLTTAQFGKLVPYGTATETVSTSASGMPGFPICTNTVVLHSFATGDTYTWLKAGVTKGMVCDMSAIRPFAGPVEITAIDIPTYAASGAAWGTGYNPDVVFTQPWSLAVGGRSTPFDAITAREGFKFDPGYTVKEHYDENEGIVAVTLLDIKPKIMFSPSNLSPAEIHELCQTIAAGGSDSVRTIGQAIGRGIGTTSFVAEDHVFTANLASGDTATFTFKSGGAKLPKGSFGPGTDRHGEIEIVPARVTTTGVGQARFSLAIA